MNIKEIDGFTMKSFDGVFIKRTPETIGENSAYQSYFRSAVIEDIGSIAFLVVDLESSAEDERVMVPVSDIKEITFKVS